MDLLNTFNEIINTSNHDLIRENANLNGESFSGKMSKFGTESSKWYALEKVVPEELKNAHLEGQIYIHDLDHYAVGNHNCTFIPFGTLLKQGFHTGHGTIRQPQSIRAAMSLVAIIFQAEQNEQFGGVGANMLDFDLAPYVQTSYYKHMKTGCEFVEEDRLEEYAWKMTKKETYQAAEALIHNLNTMNSRAGGQIPFTSINFGTDTSKWGRLVIQALLEANISGLGNGETPIFPISIFKVKEGVNRKEEDPNYDLFQLAKESMARRFYPNIANIDAPINIKYYDPKDPDTEFATMGCRTRVLADRHGKDKCSGKGNIGTVSINLVQPAIVSNSKEEYYKLIDAELDLALKANLHRWSRQKVQKAKNAPFLYGQGVWEDGSKLSPEDEVGELLKHGTLAIGFIGLAEAMKALYGKHHGESEEAHQEALELIKYMRAYVDRKSDEHDMNISLYPTPAEGLSGKFTKIDKAKFGEIPGVTDRTYYTNSYHVPVYHQLTAFEKIRKEAPFHNITNGGAIGYVEFDGNARNNIEAFSQVIEYALEQGMSYIAINHPVDRCESCKYEGIIGNECPKCKETNEDKFSRIRRVTGYLNGNYKTTFVSTKQDEVEDRVKHFGSKQ
jgi:ribonucleoside-triphosphate reductase